MNEKRLGSDDKAGYIMLGGIAGMILSALLVGLIGAGSIILFVVSAFCTIIGFVLIKAGESSDKAAHIANINAFQKEYDEYVDKMGIEKSDTQVKLFETETKGEESVLRKREEMLCRIQKMIYYFTGEMDLCVGQNKKSRRDETGTQKEDSAEPGLSASTGFCKSSWKELKGCLNDLDDVMNFLKDGQNQVQDWQIAGMNAMLDKCARGRAVPYEVSTAFKGLLRMYG